MTTPTLRFFLPTFSLFAAAIAALFAGCEPGAASSAEQVAFFEAKDIDAMEIASVEPIECAEDATEAKACAACTGTRKNFTSRRAVVKTSTISNADCMTKVDGIFDAWCVQQNIPGDCAGDCAGGKSCRPHGQGLSNSTNLDVNTGVITCEGKTYLCSCRCR